MSKLKKQNTFWWIQLCCGIVAIAFSGWTYSLVNHRPPVPALNDLPRTIRPQHNLPLAVTDRQLKTVLNKLRPQFKAPPKTNFVDHALRMWGVESTFDDEAYMSGTQMRSALLNQQQFSDNWGDRTPSLLTTSEFGIEVRTQEGRSTVSHVDHLLGTLSETGTSLQHPVVLPNGDGRVADLANHAFRSFRLNQKEYEWTAIAWGLYAVDDQPWFTRENQEITFDLMARRMMRQPLPDGVCYGNHRLYSLTILLRIDDDLQTQGRQLLQPETRHSIESWLSDMTARLYRNQSIEGYWDGNWPNINAPVPDPQTDPLSRRILATGHALEWWAMAPESLLPPRETIVRASQWLAQTIAGMDQRLIEKNYTFLSHAGRALALWRGKFPHEVDLTVSDDEAL